MEPTEEKTSTQLSKNETSHFMGGKITDLIEQLIVKNLTLDHIIMEELQPGKYNDFVFSSFQYSSSLNSSASLLREMGQQHNEQDFSACADMIEQELIVLENVNRLKYQVGI